MRRPSSLLHNDLWWDNIIVAADDVYLVDFESVKTGDYAEDLAFIRVMFDYYPQYYQRRFWHNERDEASANEFIDGIIRHYQREFDDPGLPERMQFYVALQALRRLSDQAYLETPNLDLIRLWLEQLLRPDGARSVIGK
jgi:thiamine kinase-like enzyme